MSTPWEILGLGGPPNRIEDIHTTYETRKDSLTANGDLMGLLSLEDAYLNALALWEKDDEYCEKAVKTDLIFEDLVAEHAKSEPLTATELQEIGTHIMRTLHNPWHRNSISHWKMIFDIDPIECPSDLQFESVLREALLRYFGYYSDQSGQRNKQGPRLMYPRTAQYIFARAEWTIYHRSSSAKERRELSWLRQELDVDASIEKRAQVGIHDFYTVIVVLAIVIFLFFKILEWIRT